MVTASVALHLSHFHQRRLWEIGARETSNETARAEGVSMAKPGSRGRDSPVAPVLVIFMWAAAGKALRAAATSTTAHHNKPARKQ